MKMRRKINFTGRVQGVGFRWHTKEAVRDIKVTGYVKNLSDGTVELLLEGEKGDLFRAQKAVEEKMMGYWTKREWIDLPTDPHWKEFFIRY